MTQCQVEISPGAPKSNLVILIIAPTYIVIAEY